MNTGTSTGTGTGTAGTTPSGGVLARPGDGARLSAADLACCLPIHQGELEDLARLLALVEDWLLHADEQVWADLARFLHERPPADLIDELGTQSVKLHQLARATG
ncbi:hypothetical protein GCM10009555_028260 [Acrocarpospora macrocephala]|uniref:Uncharacterized protein n=1 Tax=Acrocarpospora macrocephala TaxID=150177 RepID=A0A5M3X5M6_9ACTN|nr:hypothetical protein [Acrocarpospora macrocephala]GES17005.1 hypothetical protein Amac_106030 [Acrocarpospora macrocephala]